MIVIPGRIPIAIHPFFWVVAALIGWLYTQNFIGTLIWIGIIFVSVVVHEFGHALTASLFRQKAQIQLVALGGLTSYVGPKLRFWQQFLIAFNGPLFGFFLFLAATFLIASHLIESQAILSVIKVFQMANLFWTMINLLPILPLDGGQLLRIVLEASFGVKGFKAALLVGAILATLFALACFVVRAFLAGAIFFLFAFESFDAWRKSRLVNRADRGNEIQELMEKGDLALKAGKKSEAKGLFEEVVRRGEGGMFATAANQYLAFLEEEEGKHQEAYKRLLPMQDNLSSDAILLLHRLAAKAKNFELVAKLSSDCYQLSSTQEIALRNARAFAHLKQAKPAGGWLQTALQYEGLKLTDLLNEPEFAAIKNEPDFQEFLKGL
ncbi:MAG TPA: M50 family metallopeptidase [Chlamydiales bacterium]|nr:M50 family metallopeptidase [Chlamydiales bacterium]